MPLQFQPAPILLAGLDQKTSALTKAPGKLDRAVNVVYDKAGRLNKRRGYQLVDVADTVNNFDDDAVMLRLAQRRDELLVVTYDSVASLGSKDGALRGSDALVYRGPNNRGNGQLEHVSTCRLSSQRTDTLT